LFGTQEKDGFFNFSPSMIITAKIAEQDATQGLPALTRCQPVSFGVRHIKKEDLDEASDITICIGINRWPFLIEPC